MTTLESTILADVTRYERESGRPLPANSFYKSITIDIIKRQTKDDLQKLDYPHHSRRDHRY